MNFNDKRKYAPSRMSRRVSRPYLEDQSICGLLEIYLFRKIEISNTAWRPNFSFQKIKSVAIYIKADFLSLSLIKIHPLTQGELYSKHYFDNFIDFHSQEIYNPRNVQSGLHNRFNCGVLRPSHIRYPNCWRPRYSSTVDASQSTSRQCMPAGEVAPSSMSTIIRPPCLGGVV